MSIRVHTILEVIERHGNSLGLSNHVEVELTINYSEKYHEIKDQVSLINLFFFLLYNATVSCGGIKYYITNHLPEIDLFSAVELAVSRR